MRVDAKRIILKFFYVLDSDYRHAKRAARYLDIRGKKCLVVGCNKGMECRYFVRFGAALVDGVDIIDDIGSEYKNSKVRYCKTSVEKIQDIESNFYDLVYCYAVMEHIAHIDLAFSEMIRAAKPSGIIYCIAGPLWNSRYGHHKWDFFKKYPWIHLRMNEAEIYNYCKIEHISDPAGTDMKHHIAYMLNPLFFNKLLAERYVRTCNSLDGIEMICNKLIFEKEKYLTSEIYAELMPKGYTRQELLAKRHIFIGRKK